jgi:hypothetical protein
MFCANILFLLDDKTSSSQPSLSSINHKHIVLSPTKSLNESIASSSSSSSNNENNVYEESVFMRDDDILTQCNHDDECIDSGVIVRSKVSCFMKYMRLNYFIFVSLGCCCRSTITCTMVSIAGADGFVCKSIRI